MRLERLSAPAAWPVSIEMAMDHLRVVDYSEWGSIGAYIEAATSHLDGPCGMLGRCLVTQQWRVYLDEFRGSIRLPLPPVQAVNAVGYIDEAGAVQSFTEFETFGLGSDAPVVRPVYAATWPATRRQPECGWIDFTAGYGSPEDVPAAIRQAILLMVGNAFENREDVITGTIATELPVNSQTWLEPFRIPVF